MTPSPESARKMAATLRVLVILALVLFLVALVGTGRWWGKSPNEGTGTPSAMTSDEDCRRCHEAVWQEWQASYHSRSFSGPNVQAAFQHFGYDRKCESCHAPEPVLVTGLEREVELREADRDAGVTCSSCHAASGGGVAARRTVPDAPCRPVQTPELSSSKMCGLCHVSIYEDWTAAEQYAGKRPCADCHMPPVKGRPGGRSHLCLGGHDDATVRSGAIMECRQEGGSLVVAVTNHATGHNFPGERHHRLLFLQVIQRKPDGEITLARQERIKGITPFRGESSDEHIRAGQTFRAEFPVVRPPVEAEVRLLYKRFPWEPDWEALVVHEEMLTLTP